MLFDTSSPRNYPQTDGKTQSCFREIDRLIAAGFTRDELVDWQKKIKPRANVDHRMPETAFVYNLPTERFLGYARKWLCE